MTNRKTKEIQFKIDHLDRFGQGVFKDPATNLVTFIPGTLPEEKGTALITKSKGKVQFARLKHLEKIQTVALFLNVNTSISAQGVNIG